MSHSADPDPAEVYRGLRRKALTFPADAVATAAPPGAPYGVVMEICYPHGVATLAAYLDGSLLSVAGGREPATSAQVDCFDPATDTWQERPPLAQATSGAAGAILGATTSHSKVKGGIIGAAVGGILGGVIGNNVDKTKKPQ